MLTVGEWILDKLLEEIQDMCLQPNSTSYTCLISAYGRQRKVCDMAANSFLKMRKSGIEPNIYSHTALIHAYSVSDWHEKAYISFENMLREGIKPSIETYNILLDGFAKQGRYVDARDVISEFRKIGLAPTVMTYNILMNAYGRGGQHTRLPQLLKEMAALDDICLCPVSGFQESVFYYHKMMVKSGEVPNKRSYEKPRAILDVKAAIKNSKDRKAL